MINNTTIRVPKKYEHMIDEINYDCTGYWVNLEKGFYSPSTGCHTIHETSQKAVLEEIRKIQEETYDLKDEDGTYIEQNMSFEKAVERYKTTTRKQQMYSTQTGDKVEYLWDSCDLERSERVLFNEVMDDLEILQCDYHFSSTDEDANKMIEEIKEQARELQKVVEKELEQEVEDAYIKYTTEEIEKKRKWWLQNETV